MKNLFFFALFVLVSFTSCKKTIDGLINRSLDKTNGLNQYSSYIILQGQQPSNLSSYQRTEYDELKFSVIFDSSAIYQTANPANQSDVNKLFGFSDNGGEHQHFSARFGWNWGKEGLILYAYTYNNSIRNIQPIATVEIGTENTCSIKVRGNTYVFTLNGNSIKLPRESTTPRAVGYKLYPFFGGDEAAPQNISIWIKEY